MNEKLPTIEEAVSYLIDSLSAPPPTAEEVVRYLVDTRGTPYRLDRNWPGQEIGYPMETFGCMDFKSTELIPEFEHDSVCYMPFVFLVEVVAGERTLSDDDRTFLTAPDLQIDHKYDWYEHKDWEDED